MLTVKSPKLARDLVHKRRSAGIHHHYGEHAGYLHVSGTAPHSLEWHLGLPWYHLARDQAQKPVGASDPGVPKLAPHLTVRGRRVVQPGPLPAAKTEKAA